MKKMNAIIDVSEEILAVVQKKKRMSGTALLKARMNWKYCR